MPRPGGCQCLDLPRMHGRGDAGCQFELAPALAAPSATQVANREARRAQHAAFVEATGTTLAELR